MTISIKDMNPFANYTFVPADARLGLVERLPFVRDIGMLKNEGFGICAKTGLLVCFSCGIGVSTAEDVSDDTDESKTYLDDHLVSMHKVPSHRTVGTRGRSLNIQKAMERVHSALFKSFPDMSCIWHGRLVSTQAERLNWAPVKNYLMCPLCPWGALTEEDRSWHIIKIHGYPPLRLVSSAVPAQLLTKSIPAANLPLVFEAPVVCSVETITPDRRDETICSKASFLLEEPPVRRSAERTNTLYQTVEEEISFSLVELVVGQSNNANPSAVSRKKATDDFQADRSSIKAIKPFGKPGMNHCPQSKSSKQGYPELKLWKDGIFAGEATKLRKNDKYSRKDFLEDIGYLRSEGFASCSQTSLLVCVICRIGMLARDSKSLMVEVKRHLTKHKPKMDNYRERVEQVAERSVKIGTALRESDPRVYHGLLDRTCTKTPMPPLHWAPVRRYFLCSSSKCSWGCLHAASIRIHFRRNHELNMATVDGPRVPAQRLTSLGTGTTGIVVPVITNPGAEVSN